MKFYKVAAKCGHVGRRHYCHKFFFVKAESGKIAAQKVRNMGRVKHHHKDAILSVEEVCKDTFDAGRLASSLDPYFQARNVQEQRVYWDAVSEHVHKEAPKTGYRSKGEPVSGKSRLTVRHKIERKQKKYNMGAAWEF